MKGNKLVKNKWIARTQFLHHKSLMKSRPVIDTYNPNCNNSQLPLINHKRYQ